ncbi:unnamed protein product, partial [Brugia timori]|uniref:Secreted protein n=1 Tax=Brugia timori TaxID=42155 RepID=A0A0R3QDM8_9BILA
LFLSFFSIWSRGPRWCHWTARSNATIREFLFIRWFQNLKRAHERFIYCHHRPGIIEFSTVIWCGEQCYQLPLGKKFITILYNLMSATNEIQIMLMQELRHNFRTEGKRNTSIILTPACKTSSSLSSEA